VIIGSFVTGWLEGDAPEHGAGAKWATLCCNLANVSGTSQDLRGELVAFYRSQAGWLTTLTDVKHSRRTTPLSGYDRKRKLRFNSNLSELSAGV
jgi:hypothetical protein